MTSFEALESMGNRRTGRRKRAGKPLGPDQLRRRFLRQDQNGSEDLLEWYYESTLGPRDQYEHWDYYDPYAGGFQLNGNLYLEETFSYQIGQMIKEIGHPKIPLLPPGLVEEPEKPARVRRQPDGLAGHLCSHLNLISNLLGESRELQQEITESIGGVERFGQIHQFLKRRLAPYRFVQNVLLLSPFWVRDPLDWDGEGNGPGILRHLFELHEAPFFLRREWSMHLGIPRLKWLSWYILLGQGGSLRRAAHHFNWRIPEGFQHLLQEAPLGLSPLETCLHAEVKRVGGDQVEFQKILDNPGYVFDPTDSATSRNYLEFWQDVVRWLILRRDDRITDGQTRMILDWALHSHMADGLAGGRREFRLGRLGARAAIRRATEFHDGLDDPEKEYRWRGQGWDWSAEGGGLEGWEVRELDSSFDLREEGKAMGHCVASYSHRCVYGCSAIFSLRKDGERRLTVEISPGSRQVVQATGHQNRQPVREEINVLSRWLDTCVRGPEMASGT